MNESMNQSLEWCQDKSYTQGRVNAPREALTRIALVKRVKLRGPHQARCRFPIEWALSINEAFELIGRHLVTKAAVICVLHDCHDINWMAL